jgi:phosphatidylinositol alpha-1,6-mannosyltransferase
MISRWLGGPAFVLLLHGLDAQLAYEHPLKRFVARLILRSASAVVVNSKTTGKVVQRLFGAGVRVHVITPGVSDMEFLPREAARVRLGVGADEQVVLAISRLVERKGIDTLIEAAKALPPSDRVRIVICGDGPEEYSLRKLASACPHPVQFVSRASDEHKAEWLAAANVFCLPVKDVPNDMEGFGIAFLEGALAGLPAIAGRAGGTEEAVIDRETGLIVNGSDPREVARALMLLLGDADLQRTMGEAGRRRALTDFRWEDRWRAFQEIFRSIVCTGRSSRSSSRHGIMGHGSCTV